MRAQTIAKAPQLVGAAVRKAQRVGPGQTGCSSGRGAGRAGVANPSRREKDQNATGPEYSTKEVLVAAEVQGVIFAGVKAVVDRAGAKGIKKIPGTDPGK